jgi:hypothetical protein
MSWFETCGKEAGKRGCGKQIMVACNVRQLLSEAVVDHWGIGNCDEFVHPVMDPFHYWQKRSRFLLEGWIFWRHYMWCHWHESSQKAQKTLDVCMFLHYDANPWSVFEPQHLKIYRFETGIEKFSLNITWYVHHFHQFFLQSNHAFLKYRIQSLTIDSPQNFLDSGQEFIRFGE